MDVGKLSLHFRYVAGILIAIIVLMATRICAADTQLVAYVDFAATLSSLLLAVLAIIYSMTSNSGLLTTLAAIQNSSAQLDAKTNELARLGTVIDKLPSQLESLRKEYAAPAGTPADHARPGQPGDEFVQRFVNSTSAHGLLILYAACLANETGRTLRLGMLEKLKPDTGITFDYSWGYFIAVDATGIVDTIEAKASGAFKVMSVAEGLKNLVAAELVDRAQEDEMLKELPQLVEGIGRVFGKAQEAASGTTVPAPAPAHDSPA